MIQLRIFFKVYVWIGITYYICFLSFGLHTELLPTSATWKKRKTK